MTLYKIQIKDRQYLEWSIYTKNEDKLCDETITASPVENKMFHDDVFILNKNVVEIVESPIKKMVIPGVLVLKHNKTYGRHTNGKLLYKCIPDDPKIPSFLVPYEMKKMGFSKVFMNIYVTFCFSEWTQKHPLGVIHQVIGPIDELVNFYEYQLYCKNINVSLQKVTKKTMDSLKNIGDTEIYEFIDKKYSNIEDRTKWQVFSIDPDGSIDFDDAFSVRQMGNDITMVSIYISNVTIWLDVLNLWEHLTNRVSTIYLPDKKRTMLPTILSDNLCSLLSKYTRYAFTMDMYISNTTFEICDIKYLNTRVKLYKNYVYEESALLKDENYKLLYSLVKDGLSKINKYAYMEHIGDSHDLVQYLMIFMNYHCAKELLGKKNGIFRAVSRRHGDDNEKIPSLPPGVLNIITMIKSYSGKYVDIQKSGHSAEVLAHEMMNMDAYVHITSPIRRLVDLLNMIQIQKNMGLLELSPSAYIFYENWCLKIDDINKDTKSIKKIHADCNLLYVCDKKPELMEQIHKGYAFSQKELTHENSEYKYEYLVYLPNMNITSRFFSKEEDLLYTPRNYKMYLFNDEEKFKKKVRLQLITMTNL
uniref:RNB domain-containing protein n=1 Tax=viral metagenome TaxID=1070528 RepID=A0A6C0DFK5_9ZZZZ